MSNELQSTISAMLDGNWRSNPAMKAFIDDYVDYHQVLVVAGSLVTLVFVLGSIAFLRSSWRFRDIDGPGRRVGRNVTLGFGILFGISACLFALLVVANASTALRPLPGFSSLVSTSSTRYDSEVDRKTVEWIQNGSSTIPPVIAEKLEDRIAWQRPKAIICGVLFLLFTALSAAIWKALVKDAWRPRFSKRRHRAVALASGFGTVSASMLLLVMAVANLQGGLAPLTISVLGGS